jgi:hypothetical protein
MRSEELIVLLLLAGVGVAAVMMGSQPAAVTVPVVPPRNGFPPPPSPMLNGTAYQNAETWEIQRDPTTQRIVGYTVHRDATIGRAA